MPAIVHSYNNWILNPDQMNEDTKKSNPFQRQTPKRSFFSYICPCFNFNSIHTQKKPERSMHNTEQSNSTIPYDHIKPKESVTEVQAEISQEQLERGDMEGKKMKQSGIYITFKQDQPEMEEKTEYALMQEEYERYMRQKSKPKQRFYPINVLKENQMLTVGDQTSKILCKIRSVYIQPSQSARQLKKQGEKSQEKCNDPIIERYWEKRYFLFQKFDQGIKLDQQSWFSVTPQAVAQHIASKLSGMDVVFDGFCGAGGDSIQLGLNCKRVISNDIDPVKVKLLKNNAAVYGVDNIQTMNRDYFDIEFKRNELDAVYMSPPWGGPDYMKLQRMLPEDFDPPLQKLINKSVSLSDNVVLLLPKNTDIDSLPSIICKAFQQQKIITNSCSILLQKIFFDGIFKFIILYIGNRVTGINLGDQLEYIYRLLGNGEEPFRYKRVVKKIREELGMLRLLNFIFDCEKDNKSVESNYQRLVEFLVAHEYITREKVEKLEELDNNDAARGNQGKKQRKLEKKMIKSLKVQQKGTQTNNLTTTCVQIKNAQGNDSPSRKDKIDQTVSYISSISESKMVDTLNMQWKGSRIVFQKDDVRIEEIAQSTILQKI